MRIHTESSHVVTAPDWQETNKGNLHTGKRAEAVPGGVRDVQPRAVPSHTDENECVQREQVGDKDVSAPGGHHVTVKQSSQGSPSHGTQFQTLDPQEEGEDQQEDGNGLVVVTTSHGTGDVTWCNAHECCGKEACRGRVRHL